MPARNRMAAVVAAGAGVITALGLAVAPAASAQTAASVPYLSHFSKLKTLSSTIPFNGDVNPYGVFIVQHSTGDLHAGNVLVSNFNNNGNAQGTGRTIVQITPTGHRSLFAFINPSKLPGSCPGGVGLTTALEVLPGGWVVVGSLPSADGSAATSQAGCLIVLNSDGHVKETISGHGINGPWDSVAVTHGNWADLFVSNVLQGTAAAGGSVVNNGYVLRLTLHLSDSAPPQLVQSTVIASDYPQRTDMNAFVLGITGLGLGDDGTLYVAETLTSQIFAVPDALTRSGAAVEGNLVTQGNQLNMPLGLAIAPNGHILTVNGGDGKIVETTPAGHQIFWRFLDTSGSPKGAGALFGLAVRPDLSGVYYVDDAVNTLRLLH
jgi:hypothetical protein